MPHTPRRPISPKLLLQASDTRGITGADIDRAADALLHEGERPTIERIRARLGRGSPNTINPLLDAWWKRLAGRLDAGPAALHRLPEPVLLAAEGLWMQTLEEARRRAAAEQGSRKSSLAKDRQELEVRSHVLSIRESELNARLEQAERRTAHLEREVATLTTLLRKEQTSRVAAERRGRATQPTAAAAKAKARPEPRTKSRKATIKSPRANTAPARTVSGSPRRTRRVAQ